MKDTITGTVLEVYNSMPETFYANKLINKVRSNGYLYTFDSTILRMLRRHRNRGAINWECIDNEKAIYRKRNN